MSEKYSEWKNAHSKLVVANLENVADYCLNGDFSDILKSFHRVVDILLSYPVDCINIGITSYSEMVIEIKNTNAEDGDLKSDFDFKNSYVIGFGENDWNIVNDAAVKSRRKKAMDIYNFIEFGRIVGIFEILKESSNSKLSSLVIPGMGESTDD